MSAIQSTRNFCKSLNHEIPKLEGSKHFDDPLLKPKTKLRRGDNHVESAKLPNRETPTTSRRAATRRTTPCNFCLKENKRTSSGALPRAREEKNSRRITIHTTNESKPKVEKKPTPN
ncbi:hypothetical protein ISN45_Aa06g000560 [Arabidopsis thaliana x Arabidopsis arenosa]|uniref:Uncharacterized protein n=1 Tax=Arabidopsis thaliana x Arabidopsis arenosa TaxID=1240361 RepID=A0A8T1YRR3_9BRAS|nr:hypothetical protein ISN45_Aa06g000560 [Arabidopsis thaliana x Arabidopsis arenosa]